MEVGFLSWPLTRYKREVLFGRVDLLVSIGTIAGLFLGFSLLSGLEIIYYFTLRAWCMLHTERNSLEELSEEYARSVLSALYPAPARLVVCVPKLPSLALFASSLAHRKEKSKIDLSLRPSFMKSASSTRKAAVSPELKRADNELIGSGAPPMWKRNAMLAENKKNKKNKMYDSSTFYPYFH